MTHQPSSPLEPEPREPDTATRRGTLFVPDTVSMTDDAAEPGSSSSMADPVPERVPVDITGGAMG
ncbi:MAG TPA: hypothetical protein VHO23_02670 [Candidatus Paceibacterota bacterium]|nr:hypothetical protein [Candidatus Paceibacterota bacterium]